MIGAVTVVAKERLLDDRPSEAVRRICEIHAAGADVDHHETPRSIGLIRIELNLRGRCAPATASGGHNIGAGMAVERKTLKLRLHPGKAVLALGIPDVVSRSLA